jgi:hypothetical protein
MKVISWFALGSYGGKVRGGAVTWILNSLTSASKAATSDMVGKGWGCVE